ncbi:hypothetical protein GPX89_41220 [Nocardia sp. ET3-3]|uniref:Uncharacterized protein n=1 Tax=Nocardia terrae TaxID=2675851 RepID=A0A7K1VBZ1_9NOCA|nr:hypothetical protein [Nocardia terrae]MVU83648.1 hypothetical protein [Nocardia terrae]
MNASRVSRGLATAAAVAAVIAAPALTAPSALADITNGSTTLIGSNFTVGQSYTVNATIPVAPGATFYLIDQDVTGNTLNSTTKNPAPNWSGSTQWTPKTAGTHQIWVEEDLNGTSEYISTIITNISVAAAPASTGSASSIPVIGGLLSSLSAK